MQASDGTDNIKMKGRDFSSKNEREEKNIRLLLETGWNEILVSHLQN